MSPQATYLIRPSISDYTSTSNFAFLKFSKSTSAAFSNLGRGVSLFTGGPGLARRALRPPTLHGWSLENRVPLAPTGSHSGQSASGCIILNTVSPPGQKDRRNTIPWFDSRNFAEAQTIYGLGKFSSSIHFSIVTMSSAGDEPWPPVPPDMAHDYMAANQILEDP